MKIARKQLQTFVAKSSQFAALLAYAEGEENALPLTVTQERKQPAEALLRVSPDGYYVATFQGDLKLFDALRCQVPVGNGFVDIGIPTEANVKTYSYKKFRKPSNKISWDIGDPVAQWMRDKQLPEIEKKIAAAMDAAKERLPYTAVKGGWADPDDSWAKYFANRYGDMKHGPKRMAFGRVLRNYIKKQAERYFDNDLQAALDDFANRF